MFNFFNNLKKSVSKTAQALVGSVVDVVSGENEFSEFVLEEMEDSLISADLGVAYATELTDKIRDNANLKPSQIKDFLKKEFLETLEKAGSSKLSYRENELNIYFITGVNGAAITSCASGFGNGNITLYNASICSNCSLLTKSAFGCFCGLGRLFIGLRWKP